ncbi:MAG: NAD(P)H-hydrate dehydratase [Candidatus Sericytochromatia bacterium]
MSAIVNAATMRALDRRTIEELGLPALVLMERAALGAVAALQRRWPTQLGCVHFLVGTGNNGGDALAMARLLAEAGSRVQLWLFGDDSRRSPDCATQLAICRTLQLPEAPAAEMSEGLATASLIVDGLFGVGLNRDVDGEAAEGIAAANALAVPRMAIDMPSGLNSDTGAVMGTAFCADLTVSCALPKWAHYLDPALAYVGELNVVEIGIPQAYHASHPEQVLTPQLAARWLPPQRPANSHKGSYGRLGIVAGALGMSGAARLAAEAALQAGPGLVFLCVPASIQDQLAVALPEVQVIPLPEQAGHLAPEALEMLLRRLEPMDAVLIGPGLGRRAGVQQLVKELVTQLSQPLVLDADALYALAQQPDLPVPAGAILTPHPGELATLLAQSGACIQSDRVTAARAGAQRLGAVTVLKGARSLVAHPDGRLWFNAGGNPGMARGGMGDVLAGLCAGLLAQGLAPERAAGLAVCWHALSGDLAAAHWPAPSLTVSRLLAELPAAWAHLQI